MHDELRQLDDLQAPDVWPRVERSMPPPHDGRLEGPGPRQRVIAAVVAFAVFGGAVALALGAFGREAPVIVPAGAGPIVFTFESRDGAPHATMQVSGRTVFGNGSSYEWQDGNGSSTISDTFGTEFDFKEWIEVPAGATIEVDGDADEVRGWVDSCCDLSAPPPHISVLDLVAGATMPNEPSRYVLEFTAVWPQGDRSFYFPVEVVAQPVASPSAEAEPGAANLVATLNAPDDGSMPGLTFEYEGKRQNYFAQGGHWPGVNGFNQPLFSFLPALAPGTSIVIEGDASDITGKLEALDQDLRPTGDEVPLDLAAGSGTLPDTSGFYGLTLEGTWSRGSAAFYVVIQIGDPVVCMIAGENWELTPEQQAQWDSLPDCPDGAGKVNPHPEDPNYNPLAPAGTSTADPN
jgi:hypothetical protein